MYMYMFVIFVFGVEVQDGQITLSGVQRSSNYCARGESLGTRLHLLCVCVCSHWYMYMYMQILVAMGIQWGHGLSVYWGWWCQISWNIKVVSKNKLTSPSSIIILRCSMTFGHTLADIHTFTHKHTYIYGAV